MDDSLLPVNPKQFSNEERIKGNHYLRNEDLLKIGPITGQFYVFNQSKRLLDITFGVGKNKTIKDYIRDNCGVKVYRDNIRVYNYGEPFDDWLNLEFAKVQRAGDHFSKKVTIGAISLCLKDSEDGLIEKTNREGFSENETFWKFREIVRNFELNKSSFMSIDKVVDLQIETIEKRFETFGLYRQRRN